MKTRHIFLGLTRIALGWIFLWAFLDKTFGLGFATEKDSAWLNGGSPTNGFLSFATSGPFAEFYQSIAGNVVVDWLFMLGLLAVGLTLILGMKVYIGAYIGALMVFLMWTAVLPPENNPVIDDHIVYLLVFIVLAHSHAGDYLGLGKAWSKSKFVQKWPILR